MWCANSNELQNIDYYLVITFWSDINHLLHVVGIDIKNKL